MAFPLAAVSAGIGIAKQVFGKKKKTDNRKAIAELRAARPVGYLTPADMRAAEVTRGRLTEGVQAQGRLGGAEIARRFQARGLAGSPSEERSRARLEQDVLLGQQHAGETSEEQLYNIRQGREAFQQGNERAIFEASTGENAREADRQAAQNGAFWNSLNEFVPTIMSGLSSGGDQPLPPNLALPYQDPNVPRAPSGYQPETGPRRKPF